MNQKLHLIQQLQDIFASNGELYVDIIEYGISHGHLVFALHTGAFPKRLEVRCVGCSHIAGDLQGGPYQLQLSREAIKDRAEYLISSLDAKILVRVSLITDISPVHGGF